MTGQLQDRVGIIYGGHDTMDNAIQKVVSPEEAELEHKQAELDVLQGELAQRELELATTMAILGQFEQKYLRIVGARLVKLDEIEASIAEVLALLNPKDTSAASHAANARAQAAQSADACDQAAQDDSTQAEPFHPTEALKSLYRTLAKSVHPDLATDPQERERRTKWMADVNAAYKAGDAVRLKELQNQWQHSPDSVSGDGIGARLIRVIRQIAQIRSRIAAVDAELAQVQQSELWTLYERVNTAATDGHDLLQMLAQDLDRQIEQKRRQLNALLDEFVERKRAL